MTPKQIHLVKSSFQKVLPISETAADLFYGKLFELDPSLRSLFTGDMKEQGRKLMDMLDVLVQGLDKLQTILGAVQKLGKSHVAYGVQNKHYETVGTALLWTLEQGLGKDFTPETKQAWVETYKLVSGAMQDAGR